MTHLRFLFLKTGICICVLCGLVHMTAIAHNGQKMMYNSLDLRLTSSCEPLVVGARNLCSKPSLQPFRTRLKELLVSYSDSFKYAKALTLN